MAHWLRQSTASQEVLLGPFLDDTDGKTPETALTINASDIKLWKTGATTEANKNSGGATHITAGRYYAVLDATDTDTLGPLEINVHLTGSLPIQRKYLVFPAAVYDALVSGAEFLPVDAHKPTFAVSGTTLTVKKPDGTTTAYTKTLATDPNAEPITGAS